MRPAPQIFLSYVQLDKERVEDLYKKLSTAGFKPWMDKEDVIAGELWKSTIKNAIRDSDFFLACLSANSINKRGFLQKEIRKALNIWQDKLPDDIYLIPVRLEVCKVPEGLSDFQWVDLFEDRGWIRLLKAIQVGMERRIEVSHPIISAPLQIDMHQPDKLVSLVIETAASNDTDRIAIAASPIGLQATSELPVVTFPDELLKFIRRVAPNMWKSLDDSTQRFIVTLGTKLEPFVQIIPPTPVPLVIGFENLAIGSLGENFSQICHRVPDLDPGLLRLLLTLAALKTTSMLRVNAAQDGNAGVRHLLFAINLDPEMLDCTHIEDFLDRYQHFLESNVLFEVNEKTTLQYLRRLKDLQVDFNLRYCADDFNDWKPEVKDALQDRVEMSKVDYKTFRKAMEVRGDNPQEAINSIAAHRIAGKPLIVEGVENENYMRFLNRHWPLDKLGSLIGQGYIIKPGFPWDKWTADLRDFGLPGGHILANPPLSEDP